MTEWDEWRAAQEAKQAASLPKSAPFPPEPEQHTPRRPITEEELAKLRALRRVRFAWWCQDERFVQKFEKASLETEITERQAWFIKVLTYKYRKQLGVDPLRPEGYE
jgi:hypothetical protein